MYPGGVRWTRPIWEDGMRYFRLTSSSRTWQEVAYEPCGLGSRSGQPGLPARRTPPSRRVPGVVEAGRDRPGEGLPGRSHAARNGPALRLPRRPDRAEEEAGGPMNGIDPREHVLSHFRLEACRFGA